MRFGAFLIGFGLLFAAPAWAGDEPRASKIVVDFGTEPSATAWFSSALEEMVASELSRFTGVELAEKLDPQRCPDRDVRCLVEQYRAVGVQVIVLGRLGRRALDFEVFETWTGTRAADGSLKTTGVTSATLRRHLADVVRPIVQRGGLLDERPTTPVASEPARADGPGTPHRSAPLRYAFLALMAFLALPIGITHLLVRRRELRKVPRPASWNWLVGLLSGLATLLFFTLFVDFPALWDGPTPMPRTFALLLPVTAGMLWGAFALLTLGWVFAPIQGLGQIRHEALWPILRSWIALACLRGTLLLFYAPILMLTLRACAALAIPAQAQVALVVPAVGLLVYLWLLALVDSLSLFLDVHLVIGPANERNPWHGTIKRYFRGYLRRGAIEVDADLLERARFLPSLLPDVISYGGGFARPRILIGEAVREAALGGLPDETEFPERTINQEELPLGVVLPAMDEAPSSEEEARRQATAERVRRRRTVAPPRPRAAAPRVLGESATLLGWVLPQPGEDGIPLIANTSEDYDVVKRLLTQHYAAFERNSDDDEVDDTDPTQKDFLFGALLREMGTLARRDTFVATLWYSLALAWPRTSWLYRLFIRPANALYHQFLSGPAARVADAYAALNHGLYHLMQYLCFLRGEDETRLTARASVPRLVETSRGMLERIGERPHDDEHGLLAAHARNRLLWLSPFFHAPLASRRNRAMRLVGGVTLAVILAILAVTAVRDAVDYHPTYLDRVRSEETQSTQGVVPDGRPRAQ